MKKLFLLLTIPLLFSCEEPKVKTYKVELISGEIYHIKATGYQWYRSNGRVEFNGDRGLFFDVKCVTVEFD